jgi:CheY-specific phosphatase CheX
MADELLLHVAGEVRYMTAATFAMTFSCKAAQASLTSIALLEGRRVYLALLPRFER